MFKLAVGNVVEVPVKFALRDGAVDKTYAMRLTATRRTPKEIEAMDGVSIHDFLLQNVTGWSNQTLVLGDDGQPAPFSTDALAYLLGVPGVLLEAWKAYGRECGAKEKN